MLIVLLAVLGGLIGLAALTFVVMPLLIARRLMRVGTFAVAPPASPQPLSTVETVILGAGLGVLAGFVHSFNLGQPFPTALQALIVIASTFGINVLTGPAFRNLLNIPQGVLVPISMALAIVQMTAGYWGIGSTWAGVVQGGVTLLLSLGFGTAVTAVEAQRARPR